MRPRSPHCRRAVRALAAVGTLACALAPNTVRAQATSVPSSDSAAVAAVVTAFHAAVDRGDSLAAMALLAPDAVVLESGGIEDRAEFRAHHLAADIEFAQAVKQSRTPMRVTVSGGVAWTSATSTSSGTFRGRAVNSSGAESIVLSRGSDGRWLIRSIHWSSRARRSGA